MGLGSKPFISYDDQIALLKSKNLINNDIAKAIDILLDAGYFSLINGYDLIQKYNVNPIILDEMGLVHDWMNISGM